MSMNQEEIAASLSNEDIESAVCEERSDVENMACNEVAQSNSQDDGERKEENKNSNQSKPQNIWRKEKDVGITEFLGTHEGFSAIIKQRYSDFHVNEVNAQGEVVHLTDESIPDPPQEKQKEQIVPEGAPTCIPEEKIAEIKHMVEMSSKLTKDDGMADEKTKGETKINEVLIKVDGLEKQERTSIHLYIKTNYKKIVSSTKEINGEKYIVVKSGSSDDRWDKKTPWPKSQRYTYFVLYKENLDTMDAISQIAFKLRMKPAMFSYAGTKDKRGKTSQLVSVPELPPQRLYSVTQYNWAIMVGNFSFHHKPLKLGQLCGNRFKLVLRGISVSDELVNNAVENLKTHGFINYYGMQRFGTTHVSTHSIGKALLQGNWSEAVNLILSPRSQSKGEEYSMSKALQDYQKDGNATEALHMLYDCYKGSSLEAQLLRGISECDKNDFVGALSRLPRNMRSLYLHAYQSFIWNSMASKRIKEFGLRVLPGDLVRRRPSASAKEMLPEDESEVIDAEDSNTLEEEETKEEADNNDFENKKNMDIHVLTAEEANNTDITEILLPLPGHDILLPENEMKNWYMEMLEKDGLSLEKLKHKVKDYSVSGVYRRLLVRPSDVQHFITYYNDASNTLVQSDKEKLNGEDVEGNKLEGFPGLAEGNPIKPIDEDGISTSITGVESNLDTEMKESIQSSDQNENIEEMNKDDSKEASEKGNGEDNDTMKGRMKALVLELTLPASCYATMALRELLKIDTSTQFENKSDPANAKSTSGRGRGSFDNRRGSFGDRRGGFGGRRGGFGDRRGGFGDRRGGFGDRRGGFGDRRGGFGDRRGGFGDRRGGFGDKRKGNFDGPRGNFNENRRGGNGSRNSFGGPRKRGRF